MGRTLLKNLAMAGIIYFVSVLPSNLLASTPKNIEEFVSNVLEFERHTKDEYHNWLSPKGPWFAYLNRQFEEGLSPALQSRYLSLQLQGRCEALSDLEVAGFIALYPELSYALSGKIIENIFLNEIIPTHSLGFRRCGAHALLNPIMEMERKRDPRSYYLNIPGTNLTNEPSKFMDKREIELRTVFKILFDLAACYDYKPALKDILEYYKLHLIFIGHNERYYFYSRAKHYVLEAPDVSTVVEEIRQYDLASPYPQYNLMPILKEIEILLARDDLDAARKITFNYSYISCGKQEPE